MDGTGAKRPWGLPAEALAAIAFALVAGALGLSGLFVDDEGHITYIGAVLVGRAPVDALFFQKMHPSISVLYAPVIAWGWKAFLVWHVLLAAAAVWLIGSTARALGGQAWIAAFVLATSPLFLVSAATGLSNSSGLFLLALALWLYQRGGRATLLAGVVAAAAIWSRYEQVPYIAGLAAHAWFGRRDLRFLGAFSAVIVGYLGLGALYHGSLLWMLEYPPVLFQETGPSTLADMGLAPKHVRELLERLVLLSPLYLCPILLGPRRTLPPLARVLTVVLGLAFLVQFGLPLAGGFFNYDHTARYFLAHLPAIALLSSLALARLPALGREVAATAVAFAGVGLGAYAGFSLALIPAVVPFVLPQLLTVQGRRMAMLTAALMMVVQVGPAAMSLRGQTASLPQPGLVEFASRLRNDAPAGVVYTNAHQLDGLLAAARGWEVRFLAGYDIVIEAAAVLNSNTRQAEVLLEEMGSLLYGGAVWPCEFPRVVRPGSYLLLTDDRRAGQVYDFETWTANAEFVDALPGHTLWRVDEPFEIQPPPLPPWLSEEEFCLPCPQSCSPP